jgi:hypothetical protein
MRPRHASARVCLRLVQTPLFSLTDLYDSQRLCYRENLDRRFRPQFELSVQHRTPTDH